MANKIIDLTVLIEEGMTTFPTLWHPYVEITQLGRFGIEERETRKLVFGTHTGTHIDAPRHFIKGGKTADEIPLEILTGEAVVLDFSHLAKKHEITVNELKDQLNGRKPVRLILRYDWDEYLGTPEYYRTHPFLSDEAAQFMAESGVKLVAMDSPMPDNPLNGRGTDNDSPVHKILLSNEVVIVEYLTNLKQIKSDLVHLVVAPLKIKEADGAPARCFAIEK